MAGDWIKMRTNLWDDPRVARLCDLTDQSEAAIVGGLYWLWAMADSHTEDGALPGLTTRSIDRKTGVQGLGAALVDVGWLCEHPDGVRIAGFEQHNGTSAKRRCTDAQRKANGRKSSDQDTQDVRTVSASDADKTQTDGGEKTDNCGAREEKRREEKEGNMAETGQAGLPLLPQADANRVQTTQPRDECPHLEIINLFHEMLPTARRVRDWTPARATLLRTRWREDKKRQSLEWWRKFFAYVGESPFLTGKTSTPGRKPFELGLEWLLTAEKFARVREGAYHEAEVVE